MVLGNNSILGGILDLLVERDYGLTIKDISNALKISRSTASKYLAVMEAGNIVKMRTVGKAKLHYLKNEKNGKLIEFD